MTESHRGNFEHGISASSTPGVPSLVTKGNGSAVHIAVASTWAAGGVVPKCDTWGGSGGGGRVSRIRPSNAEAPTCKSCIRIHEREEERA